MEALALFSLVFGRIGWAEEPKLPIQVKIAWVYDGLSPGMEIHELKPGDWELWKTGVVGALDKSPAAGEIPDSTLSLPPGGRRRFALVYRNSGPAPVHFFAAPHSAEPAPYTLGFKFKCLCTNHVYLVPPGDYWYRVVELRLARDFSGGRLEVKHHIVAVDAKRAEEFAKGMEAQ